MKQYYYQYIYPYRSKILFVISALLLLISGWIWREKEEAKRLASEQLKREMSLPDTLDVVTNTGATTYFLYKEEPMGYEYELLKLLSKELERPFRLHQVENLDSIHELITSGAMDLCIRPEAVTAEARKQYQFVGLEQMSGIVLVQRRRTSRQDTMYVSQVPQLLGRKVFVEEGSRYALRLEHLAEQLGGHIDLQVAQDSIATAEELIDLVACHNIDYALIDEKTAWLAKSYYPNIDVSRQVGFPQKLQWICPKDRKGLALAIDKWAKNSHQIDNYKEIYRKYFVQQSKERMSLARLRFNWRGEYKFIKDGAISPYDSIFQREAERLGWDWRILASIAYQESNFRPEVIGWSGARGLMGIMPRTGRIFGANKPELLDPRTSVRVSVDCLLATEKMFRGIKNKEERIKFTLAGYNAGGAHVQDAQRLSRKYNKGQDSLWFDQVDRYILLKSKPQYYKDPVCRYGYLRGKETYKYVRQVMARYELYKENTKKIELIQKK